MVDQPGRFISRVGGKKKKNHAAIDDRCERIVHSLPSRTATKAGLEWKGLNASSNWRGEKMFDEVRIAKLQIQVGFSRACTEGGNACV